MANHFADINATMTAGAQATIDKKMKASLLLATGRKVPLVSGNGEVTPEGEHYYGRLGLSPPTAYPYEQPLLNGKWLIGYDGKKHLMQRMVNGHWTATHKGADYFKHNQDSYKVEYPVRQVWVSSKMRPEERGNLDKPDKDPKRDAYYVDPSQETRTPWQGT